MWLYVSDDHDEPLNPTLRAGSHTSLLLLEHGCSVTIIDNYGNSFPRVLEHMQKLAGDKAGNMKFVECSILDKDGMDKLFAAEKFDAVVHFAGYKVGICS